MNWQDYRWPWPLPVSIFIVIMGVLILLALYGWWTGAWVSELSPP